MSSSNAIESSGGMLTTIIIMLVVACVAFALSSSLQKRPDKPTENQHNSATGQQQQRLGEEKQHENHHEQEQTSQQMEDERKKRERERYEAQRERERNEAQRERERNEAQREWERERYEAQRERERYEAQRERERYEEQRAQTQNQKQTPPYQEQNNHDQRPTQGPDRQNPPFSSPANEQLPRQPTQQRSGEATNRDQKEGREPAYDYTPLDAPLEQQMIPFLNSQYLLEEASNSIEGVHSEVESFLEGVKPSADGEMELNDSMDEKTMKERQKNVDKPSKAIKVLIRVSQLLDDKMHNVLAKIPQEKQLAEERATQIALGFREGKTPVSEAEYVSFLSKLYDRKLWSLLNYLLVVAPNDRYVSQWGRMINYKCATDKSSRRALAIDLIYATLMLFDVEREIVDENNLFAGRSLYYAPAYDKSFGTKFFIVAKILLYDFFRLVSYETEHLLTHSSYDWEINHYMRYWQVRKIQQKYKTRLFTVFEQQCVRWFYSYTRSLCTATLNNKYAKQFHIAAAQIIACHITEYPILYIDTEDTLDKYAVKLWESTWRLMRDVEGRAYIMSYRVDLNSIMQAVDQTKLLRYQLLNPKIQNRGALRKIVTVNYVSNQIVMYQKHFARYLVINKPNSPLPTYWDPLDTNTGRIYLGSGLSTIVRSFDEVECFIVKSKSPAVPTTKGLKDVTERDRRIVICPFVYRRHAFEALNVDEGVTPLLRLKGAISIDTLTGYTTVGLQMQTVLERDYPMDALLNYRGWVAYALNAFVYDVQFVLDFNRFLESRSFERNTMIQIYQMRHLVEIGASSYISFLSKLKGEESKKIDFDKVNRRNYRVSLDKQNAAIKEPEMKTSESSWYSGRQNANEELIDFESMSWEQVREFGLFEEMLWSKLKIWNTEINNKLRFFLKSRGIVVNDNAVYRIASMLVILASSFKYYCPSKMSATNSMKSIAQKLSNPNDLASLPREMLDVCTCLPDKATMAGILCNLPTIAMIYERSYSQYVKSNATLADERRELTNRAVFKVTFSIDDNLTSITDEQELFLPQAAPPDGRNYSKILQPLFVPPFVITTTKTTNIDRVYSQQTELSCFNLLNTISVSKTNTSSNPLVLHVWRKQDQQWLNAVTIRVDCTADSEFKLFNVVWDSIQYLVVHQTSKVHCHDSAPGTVQAVSKLWYTINHVVDPTPERKVDFIVDSEAFDLIPTERSGKTASSQTADFRLGLDDKRIDNKIKLYYSSNLYDRYKSSWKIRLADRQLRFPRYV